MSIRQRALRRVAVDRLDTRVADVSVAFNNLSAQAKCELITSVPELYFAVARMVRMREIAVEVSR